MNKRWIALICLGMFAAAGWALCVTRPDNSHAVDINDCSHDVIQTVCAKCDRVIEAEIVGSLIGNVRVRPAVMNIETGEVFYTGDGFSVKAEMRNE